MMDSNSVSDFSGHFSAVSVVSFNAAQFNQKEFSTNACQRPQRFAIASVERNAGRKNHRTASLASDPVGFKPK